MFVTNTDGQHSERHSVNNTVDQSESLVPKLLGELVQHLDDGIAADMVVVVLRPSIGAEDDIRVRAAAAACAATGGFRAEHEVSPTTVWDSQQATMASWMTESTQQRRLGGTLSQPGQETTHCHSTSLLLGVGLSPATGRRAGAGGPPPRRARPPQHQHRRCNGVTKFPAGYAKASTDWGARAYPRPRPTTDQDATCPGHHVRNSHHDYVQSRPKPRSRPSWGCRTALRSFPSANSAATSRAPAPQ